MTKQSERRQIFGMRKTLLLISILVFNLFLTSCNPKPGNNNHSSAISPDSIPSSKVQDSVLDPIVRLLLDASAKDFHEHQPPVPVGFRNVQIRYLAAPKSESIYLICGQFLVHDKHDKDVWIPFATIKTSGYEQWIGNQSLSYCHDSKEISYNKIDLTAALKSRVDSLFNLKELSK